MTLFPSNHRDFPNVWKHPLVRECFCRFECVPLCWGVKNQSCGQGAVLLDVFMWFTLWFRSVWIRCDQPSGLCYSSLVNGTVHVLFCGRVTKANPAQQELASKENQGHQDFQAYQDSRYYRGCRIVRKRHLGLIISRGPLKMTCSLYQGDKGDQGLKVRWELFLTWVDIFAQQEMYDH